jgi:ElaB/YqjD/DUF883 family membrane-anchored ribosome-binding protein
MTTTQSTGHSESIVQPSSKHSQGNSATAALAHDVQDRVRHAVESSKAHVIEWRDGFQERVRSRPIQSVLIAAAVGAAIGMLVGRRGR